MNYAGDLSPEHAWEKVAAGARLVDVRTAPEWTHIGIPDTSAVGAEPAFVQWNLAGGAANPQFLEQLRNAVAEAKTGDGVELVFLCRSGARSVAAAEAATTAGFTAFNVLEGFEGAADAYGDRVINGWKNRHLPWKRAGA
jgi:rhodanese-related sulfurtransferase